MGPYKDRLYRIPMPGEHARSINLANALSIAAYEASRQTSGGVFSQKKNAIIWLLKRSNDIRMGR